MKPRTLVWINPKDGLFLTDGIPQVLYKIRQIDVGPIYGLQFLHGYDNEYDKSLIFKASNVSECKTKAQEHWDNYVFTNFLE